MGPLARNNSRIEFNKKIPLGFCMKTIELAVSEPKALSTFFFLSFPIVNPWFSLLDVNESPLTYLTGIFKYPFHLQLGIQIAFSLKNMLKKEYNSLFNHS